MVYDPLPRSASWRHRGAREGFEMLAVDRTADGLTLRGHTTAVEDGGVWSVGYTVEVDAAWSSRRLEATCRSVEGDRAVVVERTADGWLVDGVERLDLVDCVDVDLESSAVTNTLPVHRLTSSVGRVRAVPAVFVRAADLRVERLEQTYAPLDDRGRRYAYAAPAFDVACTLGYDRHGLVVDYPGLAVRRT